MKVAGEYQLHQQVILEFRSCRANHPRTVFVAISGINIKKKKKKKKKRKEKEKAEETERGNAAVIVILTDGDVVCLSLVLTPKFDWTGHAC